MIGRPSVPPSGQLFADISNYTRTYLPRAYQRAGHRVIMQLRQDGLFIPNGDQSAARASNSHRVDLRCIHYLFARGEHPVSEQLAMFLHTIDHNTTRWKAGDRISIDMEREGVPVAQAVEWLEEGTALLHSRGIHDYIVYTEESYLAEAGPEFCALSDWWHIADYDGRITGRFRLSHGQLFAKQYSDGAVGADPHSFAGIGPCDSNWLTPAGLQHMLLTPRPTIRR